MRLIFVPFDSLNRHVLGAYGGTAIPTPHFDRLAARCATFETHDVGSLPCMPARRDLMTGRLNFLHRAWGPLEPFDNAFPEILRAERGTYSHLVTDHYHYFEDGGVGFHGRYSSWEFFRGQEFRGQEKDKWKGVVAPPVERMRGTYHATQLDGRTERADGGGGGRAGRRRLRLAGLPRTGGAAARHPGAGPGPGAAGAVRRALDGAPVRDADARQGFEPGEGGGAAFAAFVGAEVRRRGDVIGAAGLTAG